MSSQPPKPPTASPVRLALRIAVSYVVLAVLWIFTSDALLERLVGNPAMTWGLHALKGSGFVIVTGVMLFIFCRHQFRFIIDSQQARRESERMFLTLMSNLPGMAYRGLAEEGWPMLLVSEGCADLTGHSAADFTEQRVLYERLIHPDDRDAVRAKVDEAVARGSSFRLQYRIRTAAGEERWVWEQGRPVYDDERRLVALEGFVMDITDRRRAEEYEAERRTLVQATRAMEQVLGVVGHEMRTPLAGLRASTEVLLTDGVDAEQQRSLLRIIHDETVRMSEMANNMLEAARLRQGLGAWRWTTVELKPVCKQAIGVLRPLVDPERIELDLSVEPADLSMNGDVDGIRRLLVNLLSNAARYTTDGHIRVTAQPDPEDARWILIRVQDTGSGIPAHLADKLGVAFALRHGVADARASSGAGLGLAICKEIVEAHGGRITFQSRPGEGTTFHVRLRADLPEPRTADQLQPITQIDPR